MRRTVCVDDARLHERGRQHDAHAVHVGEPAQRQPFVLDTVLSTHDVDLAAARVGQVARTRPVCPDSSPSAGRRRRRRVATWSIRSATGTAIAVVPDESLIVSPRARIASQCDPRATSVTSWPCASACWNSRPPMTLPTAPAPKITMRIRAVCLGGETRRTSSSSSSELAHHPCLSAPSDSSDAHRDRRVDFRTATVRFSTRRPLGHSPP